MDDQHKNIVDTCRLKSEPLASVCFKIRSKGIDGSPLNLECREFIAKSIMKRIEEKVKPYKIRSWEKVAACTVIPYFDIDYFSLHQVLKLFSDATPNPFGQPQDLRQSEYIRTESVDSLTEGDTGDRGDIPIQLPRKFLRKSSLRASFDNGMHDHFDIFDSQQLRKSVALPSWDVSNPPQTVQNPSRPSRSLTQGSELAVDLKAGSSITIGNISILFRIGRDLKPREKFKSTQTFDACLAQIQQLFGLHANITSIKEISNQSISRLVYYFNLSESEQAKIQLRQSEAAISEQKSPQAVAAEPKSSALVKYYDNSHSNELFAGSLFVTRGMLSLLTKLIPEYITNLGVEILYSRIRDGTSYQR